MNLWLRKWLCKIGQSGVSFWMKAAVFGKLYLVKMCPIFDSSASNHLKRYQKILWVCSFRCKNLLNFTWNTMKFDNPIHFNLKPYSKISIHGIICKNSFFNKGNTVKFFGLQKQFWQEIQILRLPELILL